MHTSHALYSSDQTKATFPEATSAMANQPGYVGDDAIMSPCPAIPVSIMPKTGAFPGHIHEEILRLTGATSLPSPSRMQTFIEAYFKHIYYRAPVIDRSDLQGEAPSTLLLQAICMIGSQLRYPREQSPLAISEEYYLKVKTLLFTGHEINNFMVLKALCILCFWFVPPPVVVSLDGAWHWLGVAIRHAYQMGLHRESTCSKISNPGVARRIMWFLFVSMSSNRVRRVCNKFYHRLKTHSRLRLLGVLRCSNVMISTWSRCHLMISKSRIRPRNCSSSTSS